jgi:hypothetical protein
MDPSPVAANPGQTWRYDVAADGQRFLMSVPVDSADTSPISVIVNWTTALNK